MKLLKKLILLSNIVLISACATTPPTVLPKEKPVTVNEKIMLDCGLLIDSLPKGASFEDTLIAHAEDAKTFATCKELNNSKKKIIEEFLLNARPK